MPRDVEDDALPHENDPSVRRDLPDAAMSERARSTGIRKGSTQLQLRHFAIAASKTGCSLKQSGAIDKPNHLIRLNFHDLTVNKLHVSDLAALLNQFGDQN